MHKRHKHFAMPRFSESSFIVKHYAADVCYTALGFLAKNRDSVAQEVMDMLSVSDNPLLREMFPAAPEPTTTTKAKRRGAASRKPKKARVRTPPYMA